MVAAGQPLGDLSTVNGAINVEDKAMIESQQKIVDTAHGETMMTLSFDRSVAQFRRLMTKLVEADSHLDTSASAPPR